MDGQIAFSDEDAARFFFTPLKNGDHSLLTAPGIHPIVRLVKQHLCQIGFPVANSWRQPCFELEHPAAEFGFELLSFPSVKSLGHIFNEVTFPRLDLSRLPWLRMMTHDSLPRSKTRSFRRQRTPADRELWPVEAIVS